MKTLLDAAQDAMKQIDRFGVGSNDPAFMGAVHDLRTAITAAKAATSGPREIVSPEGVEELVKVEIIYRITLTGGGKFRNYYSSMADGVKENVDMQSCGIHGTLEEALKNLGGLIIMHGLLMYDPAKGTEAIMRSMLKGGKP